MEPRVDSMEPDTTKTKIKISKSYPLEFCYVKSLLLQEQYRLCISTCREILEGDSEDYARHPLERPFMQFYIALAHDELGRAMHQQSSSKLSAFDQAEILYREAAKAIPGTEDCHHLLQKHGSGLDQSQSGQSTSLPQSTSQSTIDSEVFQRPPSPSPFLSPPTHAYSPLPNIVSPDRSSSEAEDDLENHDSFSQLTTPPRMQRLPSTFSSMSLLDPQRQAHGLLRPVRPGSIATPYQPPHDSSSPSKHYRSRLPRLNTNSSLVSPQPTPPKQSSPVRKQLRSPDEDWSPMASPTSPVSPLNSVYEGSDDGTISPISPSTPVDERTEHDFSKTPALSTSGTTTAHPFIEHVEGLRTQIDAHIGLLQQARECTVAAQAERAIKNSTRKVPASKANKLSGMQQSRSFWLFTPEDVKAMDKQRRIEEGRKRMWARPRFDPSRYRGLAERALEEL